MDYAGRHFLSEMNYCHANCFELCVEYSVTTLGSVYSEFGYNDQILASKSLISELNSPVAMITCIQCTIFFTSS